MKITQKQCRRIKIFNYYHNIAFKLIMNQENYKNNNTFVKIAKLIHGTNMNQKEEFPFYNRLKAYGTYNNMISDIKGNYNFK